MDCALGGAKLPIAPGATLTDPAAGVCSVALDSLIGVPSAANIGSAGFVRGAVDAAIAGSAARAP